MEVAHTPPDQYPLLLHFHPLVIYRHQVLKQADVVMAMFLLGHFFSEEEKRKGRSDASRKIFSLIAERFLFSAGSSFDLCALYVVGMAAIGYG